MTTGETRARGLHIDLRPVGTSRDFRVLFASRTITLAGSQATEVALLVQPGSCGTRPSRMRCGAGWPAWRC
jgi:hypothetical protein